MIVLEFLPEHVAQMRAQPAQAREVNAESLAAPFGQAWTAMLDGHPIACAGVVEVWRGRAYAWALLSDEAGPHMLRLTREIRSRLERLPFRRVEMAVDAGFPEAARWARVLGFWLETPNPMRGYLPNGRDAWLYARLKDGFCTADAGSLDGRSGNRVDL